MKKRRKERVRNSEGWKTKWTLYFIGKQSVARTVGGRILKGVKLKR